MPQGRMVTPQLQQVQLQQVAPAAGTHSSGP